jgi:hypothetical protein
MKVTELIGIAGLVLTSPNLAHLPSVAELNLQPHAFDVSAVRTIRSIACEGASNGLPRTDIRKMVKLILPPNAKREYTPTELNRQIDEIVRYAMPCRVR